jgi:error-prone DNA polymerase
MGLRFVKGLGEGDWGKIDAARRERPFASLADLARRTRLDVGALTGLAEAGAFERFGLGRRQALWEMRGLARAARDAIDLPRREARLELEPLGSFETIGWDYVASGHSTRGHPLGPLRPQLEALGLPTARALTAMKDGRRARYAGMVICRQRPSTASGVTFMTLEDETGFVNLVLWKDVFGRHEIVAKTAYLLGVSGRIQAQEGVTHLIADELWIPDLDLRPETAGSRDFVATGRGSPWSPRRGPRCLPPRGRRWRARWPPWRRRPASRYRR